MRTFKLASFALLVAVATLGADWGMTNWIHGSEQFLETGIPRPPFYQENGGKLADNPPIQFVAFGDMMLGRYVWTLMQQNGLDYPLMHFPELLDSMVGDGDADFIMANLEGPISDSDYVNSGTAMRFNFRPEVVEPLTAYGFNLFNLANNHAYDMGDYGASETRKNLENAGIHYFGDARQINEYSAWTTTIDGTTLTFIGLNDTVSDHLDYDAAVEFIRDFEVDSDFTIVMIHWGNEYWTTAAQSQVDHAHAMVDAGADVIIGHHPHVIQNSEWYNGRPIYYSLGNFIFDQYFQRNVQEGLGLTITLQKSDDPLKGDTIEVEETVFDIWSSQPQVRTS